MIEMTLAEWQLFIIRVYLGLDMIPHFLEKLAGPTHYHEAVKDFIAMGVPNPSFMVILAGLIELAISIGFTFGFLTRVAAVGAAIYLIITLFLGHHNANGFIWALPGGGWEYPALWAFISLTYVLTGGGPISVDSWFYKYFKSKK